MRDRVVYAFGSRRVIFQCRVNDSEELPPCSLRPLDGHYWLSRALRILAWASVLTLFMGDQFASVRLLYTIPDLLNLPGLDVQILVNGVTDHLVRERSSTWAKASSWRCFSGGIRTVKTPSAVVVLRGRCNHV